MPLTLAIDTTADWGSIALADEEGTRDEVLLEAPRGFSHILFGTTQALLNRNGTALKDIQLLAGASGPGSFTGVRVGLAAIKGMAETLSRPAVAISNLEALAAVGRAPLRAAVIDAHRGEVFAAIYDSAGKCVLAESVLPVETFIQACGDRAFEWISGDEKMLALAPVNARRVNAPRTLAGVIAKLAIRKLSEGDWGDPALIEANYVRRSDAELLWKEP